MVVHYDKGFIPVHKTGSTNGQWHVLGSYAPPLTSKAPVGSQASICGICDVKVVLVLVFLKYLFSFLLLPFHEFFHIHFVICFSKRQCR